MARFNIWEIEIDGQKEYFVGWDVGNFRKAIQGITKNSDPRLEYYSGKIIGKHEFLITQTISSDIGICKLVARVPAQSSEEAMERFQLEKKWSPLKGQKP